MIRFPRTDAFTIIGLIIGLSILENSMSTQLISHSFDMYDGNFIICQILNKGFNG